VASKKRPGSQRKSASTPDSVQTYMTPADGAFVYLDHPELKAIRVMQTGDEIWDLIESDDPDEFESWIQLTVRRSIAADAGPAGPFIEEQIRIRLSKITAFV